MSDFLKYKELSIISQAFESVSRSDFLPDDVKEFSPCDIPVHIGKGQTCSSPSTLRFMLQLLEPFEGMSALDIGSGSGWSSALLSFMAGADGKVTALERVPELYAAASERLRHYNFTNLRMFNASFPDFEFDPGGYDRILISAADKYIPPELKALLKNNGIAVCVAENTLVKVEKVWGELKLKCYPGFAFVPLVRD